MTPRQSERLVFDHGALRLKVDGVDGVTAVYTVATVIQTMETHERLIDALERFSQAQGHDILRELLKALSGTFTDKLGMTSLYRVLATTVVGAYESGIIHEQRRKRGV